MQTLIYNATLVLPDRLLENGWLLITDERIEGLGTGISRPSNVGRQVDAGGAFVMPGLIDLHCDAIEKMVEPRPGVHFDLHIALHEIDRRLAGCGITTEYHAISLDDHEFGVRSVSFARELSQEVRSDWHSLVRHNIHARLELTSQFGFEIISRMIVENEVGLVSLMDHSPGQGQYASEAAYRDYVKRTVHKTDEEIDAFLIGKRKQKAEIPNRIKIVTQLARESGIIMATHDDDTAEKVAGWPEYGVNFVEFPTTMEAAKKAKELKLGVCMGAPNVVRGKSSGGNMSAIESIKAGVTDVLCADYYPSAMLVAVFKLAFTKVLSLPEATRMVTLNAAKAVGLQKNFGSLEPGKIADVILVDLNRHKMPHVQGVFVGGDEKLLMRSRGHQSHNNLKS